MEDKPQEAENMYKRILEFYPANMIALKKVAKILLKRGDYSNAYIYINKALKLSDSEAELWNMLSTYYINNGDKAKYYECFIKELELSKFHFNAILSDLIPKIII